MNPYQNDIQTILQVLGILGIWMMIGMVDEPIVAFLGGVFCLLVWAANLYAKLRYRSNPSPDEIRFPTQNDTYYRLTSLTLGSIGLLGSVGCLLLMNDVLLMGIVGLCAGGLVLTNGLLDVPKGQLVIQHAKISGTGIGEAVSLGEIRSVKIQPDRLIIALQAGQKIKIEGLKLDETWIAQLGEFLNTRLGIHSVEISGGNP